MSGAIEIPVGELGQDSLRSLVEAFVIREGTDYGSVETSLTVKVDQVMAQLRDRRARILWDSESESFDIQRVG